MDPDSQDKHLSRISTLCTEVLRAHADPADAAAAPAPSSADNERDFLATWREQLLERTWQALAEANAAYHAALLLRIHSPDLTSALMAEELGARLGQPLTADWVRKAVQRAQAWFTDLLIKEVMTSLEGATEEQLRAELREVDLLRYRRSARERRGRGS
jgi:hypothetical protein